MRFNNLFGRRGTRKYVEINPDEILLDSKNIPKYDRGQCEGRLEKPISKAALYGIGGVLAVIFAAFIIQAWKLQIANGQSYAERSEKNMLRPVPLFAARGTIVDRNRMLLAWNAPSDNDAQAGENETSARDETDAVARRMYATSTGLAHVLGYVQYPSKDDNGFYYKEDFEGVDGVEKYFNDELRGTNGSRLVEVDARGEVLSENIVRSPIQGDNIELSIDGKVQSALYENIRRVAEDRGFVGGAGIVMDTRTGEVLAMTSYPEFDSQAMSDNRDSNRVKAMLNDPSLPFLDRAIDGLYAPGSIVKPYLALGVLNEKIIDPLKKINNTGSISIQNPYDPTKSTVFKDWKALGIVDLRRAIAMSSDVYFYIVGGGYKDQKGLGIRGIDKYLSLFGFGSPIPDSFFSGKTGTVPTPEWKMETFNEDWYLGNTYHTAIGQYGTLTTPVQIVRAVAALGNGGALIVPTIGKGAKPAVERNIEIPMEYFDIVREGMRMGVREGTVTALNVPYVAVAGKTGTAELGAAKDKVNSWITGFWPYENPRYAFAVVLERGSVKNQVGAAAAMRGFLEWMNKNAPEYFKP